MICWDTEGEAEPVECGLLLTCERIRTTVAALLDEFLVFEQPLVHASRGSRVRAHVEPEDGEGDMVVPHGGTRVQRRPRHCIEQLAPGALKPLSIHVPGPLDETAWTTEMEWTKVTEMKWTVSMSCGVARGSLICGGNEGLVILSQGSQQLDA